MDRTIAEPFVLDWEFDDEAFVSGSVDLSGTKPEMLDAGDLHSTTTADWMNSDLFCNISDTSDMCSGSDDDENEIIVFDPDIEDVQGVECLATAARER